MIGRLEVKLSSDDAELMGELITIICSWDRGKLPVEYKEQLEAWAYKFLKEVDEQ